MRDVGWGRMFERESGGVGGTGRPEGWASPARTCTHTTWYTGDAIFDPSADPPSLLRLRPSLPLPSQALAEADRYYLSDTYKREVGGGVGLRVG